MRRNTKSSRSDYLVATLIALVLWTCFSFSASWPLPENPTALLLPLRFFKSSAVGVTPISAVARAKAKKETGEAGAATQHDKSSDSVGLNLYRLPPSPVDLLKPDGFQFYAYNERGDMITKQMTMQEIQALIASGGPDHSNAGIQEPQKAEDILTGGKKVIDVVEKVQSVLKSAMGKPPTTFTASYPMIPEKANAEWSSILPAILAADKYDNKIEEKESLKPIVSQPAVHHHSFSDSSKSNSSGATPSDRLQPIGSVSSQNQQTAVESKGDETSGTSGTSETTEPASTIASEFEIATASFAEKLMIPVSVITTERATQPTSHASILPNTTRLAASFNNLTSQHYHYHQQHSKLTTADVVRTTPFFQSTENHLYSHSHSHSDLGSDSRPDSDVNSDLQLNWRNTSLPSNEASDQVTIEGLLTTETPSLHQSNQVQSSLANESFTTLLIGEFASTEQPFKPLSVELTNSLSSVFGQIFEEPTVSSSFSTSSFSSSSTSASTSFSSGFELSVSESSNHSEMTSSTVSASTIPSRIEEELPENSTIESEERTEESRTEATGEFQADRDHLYFTSSSVSIGSSTSMPLHQPMSPQLALNAADADAVAVAVAVASTPIASVSQLASLPVAIIHNILDTASPELNTPVTDALVFPNDLPANLSANTLASALIAGFPSSNFNGTQGVFDEGERTTATATATVTATATTTTKATTTTTTTLQPHHRQHLHSTPAMSNSMLNVLNAAENTESSDKGVMTSDTTDRTVFVTQAYVNSSQMQTQMQLQMQMQNESSMLGGVTKSVITDEGENEGEGGGISVNDLVTEDTASSEALTNVNTESMEGLVVGNEVIPCPEATFRPPSQKIKETCSTDLDDATTRLAEISSTLSTRNEEASYHTAITADPSQSSTSSSESDTSLVYNAFDASISNESVSLADRISGTANKTPQIHNNLTDGKLNATKIVNPQRANANANANANASTSTWQRISLHQTPSLSTTFPTTTKKTDWKLSSVWSASGKERNSSEDSGTESTVSLDGLKTVAGLDSSTRNASIDVVNFSRLCNQLAMKFWSAVNKGLSSGRSLAVSPFGIISLLAMIFLGARGSTSEQMNEVLGLDNVATFNPHLIFQNVTDAVSLARHQGIANAAFVRELFADKAKVRKLLPFYKEQAQQFYEGLVAEVNFATIGDLARRRTNLLVRKQTGGRIKDFVKSNTVALRSPLAAISANVFQTECNASSASAAGRDGELYFAVSSAHRLRKLIPVPAIVWRSNILAGYEPGLDATAIAIGTADSLVSTIFLLPGQQGHAAPGDTLHRLEQRLLQAAFPEAAWDKLLRVLVPRTAFQLQIPKFAHRSVINATAALKNMGLDQLFSNHADFKGINGIGNRLFLSDVLQMNLFGTCGDESVANGRHHAEIYPASPSLRTSAHSEERWRADQATLANDATVPSTADPTLSQVNATTDHHYYTSNVDKSQEKARLKLDQPFLYFARHNPTGLILHMGRFNPRLI